jgi:tRNA-Thr(GGU) m(6)t(6)A37 methyltransferase TsaA
MLGTKRRNRKTVRLPIPPIGVIRSPWRDARGTPVQPVFAKGARGSLEIDPLYAEALADIDAFDRIWLLYWLDRAGSFQPTVTPYLDSRPHGLFATRAPARPVPIGLSAVRLIECRGCTIEVADLDVLDGTPLLDIKPYVPRFDAFRGRAGWLDAAPLQEPFDDGRFANLTPDSRRPEGEG